MSIEFKLEGMLFKSTLPDSALTFCDPNDNNTPAIIEDDTCDSNTRATGSRRLGGAKGDDRVVFEVTATGEILTTTHATLNIDDLALPANGVGSVVVTSNAEIGGVVHERVTIIPNAIMTAAALREYSQDPPASQTATVVDDFMSFANTAAQKHIGTLSTLHVTLAGQGSMTPDPDVVADLDAQLTSAGDADTPVTLLSQIADLSESMITVNGDFSFVERATLALNSVGCGATGDHRTDTDERDAVTERSDSELTRPLSAATAPMLLCLHVDGETVITPSTYTATVSYVEVDGNAMAPMSGGELPMGVIILDGETVIVPYITTVDGKNQRIIMSNRGTRAARYVISFRPETGTEAVDGMYARGEIAAGETLVYHVRDIVTLTGDSRRTAATAHFVAPIGTIDVSSTITNRATGAQSLEDHNK
jgi:hypothetical protein